MDVELAMLWADADGAARGVQEEVRSSPELRVVLEILSWQRGPVGSSELIHGTGLLAGAVYPALNLLVARHLITVWRGPDGSLYKISEAGRRVLSLDKQPVEQPIQSPGAIGRHRRPDSELAGPDQEERREVSHAEVPSQLQSIGTVVNSLPDQVAVIGAQSLQQRQVEETGWNSVMKLITNIGGITEAMRLVSPPETLKPLVLLLDVLDLTQLPRIVRRDDRAFTQGETDVLSNWMTKEYGQLSRWVRYAAIAKLMNVTSQSQYVAAISTDGGKTTRELGRFPTLPEAEAACRIAGRDKHNRSFEPLNGWSRVKGTDGSFRPGRISTVVKKPDGTFLYLAIQAVTPGTERATRNAGIAGYSRPGALGERNSRVIPQDVKVAVAARDQGRCVQCGSREDLHYDHKIPWSRGGANTVNNIQLLCGRCNRRKGAREGI